VGRAIRFSVESHQVQAEARAATVARCPQQMAIESSHSLAMLSGADETFDIVAFHPKIAQLPIVQ
jgi:hypothetical protein